MSGPRLLLTEWEARAPAEKQKYLHSNRLYLNRYTNRDGIKVDKEKAEFVEFEKHDKSVNIRPM